MEGGDFLKKTSTKLHKMEGGKKSKKSINVEVGKKIKCRTLVIFDKLEAEMI